MAFIAVISFAPSSLQLNLRVVILSQTIVIGVVVMHMLNFLHLERRGPGILIEKIETLVGDMTPGSKKAISLIVKTNSTPNFREHYSLLIR
jgi:hypothetical protein